MHNLDSVLWCILCFRFSFLGGGVPRSASCEVCVSRLVGLAGAYGCVAGFNTRGGLLARRLLGQGYWCRRLRGAFSGFRGRCCGLVSEFRVRLYDGSDLSIDEMVGA